MNQALVLCAGEGTRLLPLTERIPKCLVSIKEKKVLEFILEYLASNNVTQVICNISNLRQKLEEFRANSNSYFEISYEKKALGTAGAIFNCLNELNSKFFVIYGDVLTNACLEKLQAFFKKNDADVAFYVNKSLEPKTGGIVTFDHQFIVNSIIEKPESCDPNSYINSGILIFNKRIFEKISQTFFDIANDLIPYLISSGFKVVALPILDHEFVHDMGTFERLEKAKERILDHRL